MSVVYQSSPPDQYILMDIQQVNYPPEVNLHGPVAYMYDIIIHHQYRGMLGDIHTVVIAGLHDKGDGLTGCGREVMKWGRVPQDTS